MNFETRSKHLFTYQLSITNRSKNISQVNVFTNVLQVRPPKETFRMKTLDYVN